MDARRGDARVRRGRAHRTRLVRHSALADALDQRRDGPPPPSRRVAGQPALQHREVVAALEPAPAAEPDATALLPLFYRDEPPPRLSPAVRRAVVVACAVGVLVAAGLTGYLLSHRTSKHAATRAPAAVAPGATVAQAENWIGQNVPRQDTVRAAASISDHLLAEGYAAASVYRSFDSHSAGSVLVTTPEIRTQVRYGLATAAGSLSALPIATFGSGAQRVDVAVLVAGRAATLPDRVNRETTERTAADHALATNPRVAAPAALRPWLADGRLDLRAATVLALIAARTDAHITRITRDAAEAAAGRPARSLALSMTDPDALADVLRQLPPPYAPVQVATLPDGTRQLTWPFGLAPEGLF